MLIVGLGNPGKEYEWTRHNLGFMLIDKLAHDEGIVVGRRECSSLVGRGQIEGAATKLAKPQTFMNLSGHAVSCLLAKIQSESPVEQLIVVSDDLALPLGTIRIRERGSAGGHNGLKSIIAAIGTNEFLRFGSGFNRSIRSRIRSSLCSTLFHAVNERWWPRSWTRARTQYERSSGMAL